MAKKLLLAAMFAIITASMALGATSSDVSFDLRGTNRLPSQIRNQGNYGLCWTFGSSAAMESNYMTGLKDNELASVPELNDPTADNPHISELYFGWFGFYNPDPKKSYLVFSATSGDKKLLSLEELRANPDKVIQGSNWCVPTAMMTRGFGPIEYTALPYNTPLNALLDKTPGDSAYQRRLLLTNTNSMRYPEQAKDPDGKRRKAIIADIKTLLIEDGAMYLRYVEVNNSRNAEWKTYYCSEAQEKATSDDKKDGHIVAIIGWDDNFPADSFDVPNREKPKENGAWLIRNSWGTERKDHEDGCFWMSYEQSIEAVSFNVENLERNIVCYDWDPLGWCSDWESERNDAYAINVFKNGNQDVKLERIGFYTCNYDTVTLYINTSYGTTKPTTNTVKLGDKIDTREYGYSGYHAYKLSSDKNIIIPANSYFSIGLQVHKDPKEPDYRPGIAIETRLKGYSDYAQVFDGESYFSDGGTTWTDGTKMLLMDEDTKKLKVSPMNACIKAFVSSTTGGIVQQPEKSIDEQTIDGRNWTERPDNTVSDASIMDANNPSGENAAVRVGRQLSLFLLDNDGNPLASGTRATLNFLYLGTGDSYDLYYDDDDDDGIDYGYSEKPGDEWAFDLYPEGYDPHGYINDDGEFYADYVKTVTVGANGQVVIDADDIATDSEGKTIPAAYYDVYYTASGDSIVGTLPVVEITDSEAPEKTAQVLGSNKGGCNALLGGFIMCVAILFMKGKHVS